jgi:nucleoside-diphosphate-sugar epimerase
MILVTGACGLTGTELVKALRLRYGRDAVIASDMAAVIEGMQEDGPYCRLDVLDKYQLEKLVETRAVTQIYHLAATLSANGEKAPMAAWELNIQGLLNVLEAARQAKIEKVFWPSSIAVFGPGSHRAACPQHTFTDPATVYGISKCAGEYWVNYYHRKYGLDVRSLRYPGLVSHSAKPGGGTTDYAVELFHAALEKRAYTCFLEKHTLLPMMYMPDAVRATLELMEAPEEQLSVRTSYNIAGMSFSPADLAGELFKYFPGLKVGYCPDFRQGIAAGWPASVDDHYARKEWGWRPAYDLEAMTAAMLEQLPYPERNGYFFRKAFRLKEVPGGQMK